MKKLIFLLLFSLLANTIFATGRFFVPVYINHNFYGELTATLPELFLTIYDENEEAVYEETFTNVEMTNGRTKLQIEDENQEKISDTARSVGIFVPEFEEEYIFKIQEVPFSRIAHKAQHIEWEGVKNQPLLGDLEGNLSAERIDGLNQKIVDLQKSIEEKTAAATFKNNIENDDDVVSLKITNSRQKNNSKSGLDISHDDENSVAFIGIEKSNSGSNTLQIKSETEDAIEFLQDDEVVMSIDKETITLHKPISGEKVVPISALDIKKSDLISLGLPEADTTLSDREIAALGYIKQDTTLSDQDISDLGYIKSYSDTTLTEEQIQALGFAKEATFTTAGANKATSGASKIGVYDSFENSDSIELQAVLTDLDEAISNIPEDTNTQLTEAEVDQIVENNGYANLNDLTTGGSNSSTSGASNIGVYNEFAYSNASNVQDLLDDLDQAIDIVSKSTISEQEIEKMGFIKSFTDTHLTEAKVDEYVSDNGFLTSDSTLNVNNLSGTIDNARLDTDLQDLSDGILTGTKVSQATTSTRGTVQLSNSYSSSSTTKAVTEKGVNDLRESLGDVAYANFDDEKITFENTVKVSHLVYDTIEKDMDNDGIVKVDNPNAGLVAKAGVANFASGHFKIPAHGEETITFPYSIEHARIEYICSTSNTNIAVDNNSNVMFLTSWYALSNNFISGASVRTNIGNDTLMVHNKTDGHCAATAATEDSFTIHGASVDLYVTFFVTSAN